MNTPNNSSLVFVGVAPHPPIMVPEVGGAEVTQVRDSGEAMKVFTERILANGTETIIIITPHAPLEPDAFVAYNQNPLSGNFARFNSPQTKVAAPLDAELLAEIKLTAREENYSVVELSDEPLDHGTAVPLYFLQKHGYTGSLVAFGYSFLSHEDHLRFGACLRRAIDKLNRPVAIVASGDLSHRLTPSAPAGFDSEAHTFDEQIVAALANSSPQQIIGIDQALRRRAGECGYRSMLVALGAVSNSEPNCEVLNYEAPFGVGYLVAQLDVATNLDVITTQPADSFLDGPQLLALARRAVETYVRERIQFEPDLSSLSPSLLKPAACFVSLKTPEGKLRGCIGTVFPEKKSLALEVVYNAVSAANYDPRFSAVTPAEFNDLRYSVDVLSAPEPASLDSLDPKNYGVIVGNDDSTRRGLLLPDIEGVDTKEDQVAIAAHKAGLTVDKVTTLSRFTVKRFREA